MHPNPTFRKADTDRNIAFARRQGFGMLTVSTDAAPLVSHLPFVLDAKGAYAEMHLVRSNPIVRLLSEPRQACLAVVGPQGYISPDWYGIDDQVPTWNYVAVHLRGTLEGQAPDDLLPHLDRLSQRFEAELRPKPAWTTAKMNRDALDRMLRQIVPVRLTIHEVDGTWKLGQNKTDSARLGGAAGLENSGIGQDLPELARLMRDPPA